MKMDAAALLQQLPGKVSEKWPSGERFITAFTHGTMAVEFFAPRGTDPQTPHEQDELYFIHSGEGELTIGAARPAFSRWGIEMAPSRHWPQFCRQWPDHLR